jgi:chemotaxis response regulator CheB
MIEPAIHIPDAPPALADLLRRLPVETGSFLVTQHHSAPQPAEW